MTDAAHYSGTAVARAPERRRDASWIASRLADPETRFVPVWRGKSLIVGRRAALLTAGEAGGPDKGAPGETIFLGVDERHALFALDLSHLDDGEAGGLGVEAGFVDLHAVAPGLARREASLLSHAAWLVRWSRRHRFCGSCGGQTRAEEAGHVRRCSDPACGAVGFPRIDPAVIVLVEHEDRCLLARQKGWPGRLHSCLAGFVEPGESAEEAVRREVREEAGLDVRDLRFRATQPWPYPCSLMLGFHARADDPTLRLCPDELAEARWTRRAELARPERLDMELPRADSIARQLIGDWMARA